MADTDQTPDAVRAMLEDEAFIVPPADTADAPPGTMGWLRATVARFCNGADHVRRRGLVEGELARIDSARLRALAAERAGNGEDEEARFVPVAVLAGEMHVDRDRLADAVAAVRSVAAAYHPGATTAQTARADAAVAAMVALLPPAEAEVTANRIGLLVQTCAATAGLIDNATKLVAAGAPCASVDELVALTLRDDPPVRSTRRRGPGGAVVELDLAAAALPFGHGLRPCPGRDHAVALASGVLDSVCSAAAERGR
jgi:cytochrome P450